MRGGKSSRGMRTWGTEKGMVGYVEEGTGSVIEMGGTRSTTGRGERRARLEERGRGRSTGDAGRGGRLLS